MSYLLTDGWVLLRRATSALSIQKKAVEEHSTRRMASISLPKAFAVCGDMSPPPWQILWWSALFSLAKSALTAMLAPFFFYLSKIIVGQLRVLHQHRQSTTRDQQKSIVRTRSLIQPSQLSNAALPSWLQSTLVLLFESARKMPSRCDTGFLRVAILQFRPSRNGFSL